MSGSIGHLLARACQRSRTSWPVGARGFEELVTMDRSAKNIFPRADMRRELVAWTGMDPGRVEDVIIERVAS